MKVENILICGGGTAGWMTAAGLLKAYPNLNITLIESSDVPAIGVGESTIGAINDFLHFLGLKDEEWMPYCNATYKASIKFTDFHTKGTHYHYPFGNLEDIGHMDGDPKRGGHDFMDDWFRLHAHSVDAGDPLPYSDFAEIFHCQVPMVDQNKFSDKTDFTDEERGFVGWKSFDPDHEIAYHMDAGLFGQWLKTNYCKPRGITHIVDNITKVNTNDTDDWMKKLVTNVETENNGTLTADLYIDATGFKAMIIDKEFKVPFTSYTDRLLNNKAIATRLPYVDKETQMEPVTNGTALKNGWCWNIPLWHRIGTGYVYSDKFTTTAEAKVEFIDYLNKKQKDAGYDGDNFVEDHDLNLFEIDIRTGRHALPFVGNMMATGLSAGFIEPLESTGLALMHEMCQRLVDAMNRPAEGGGQWIGKADKDMINLKTIRQLDSFRDFILWHFYLSQRTDSEYWRYITDEMEGFPDELNNKQIHPYHKSLTDLAYRRFSEHEFNSGPQGGTVCIAVGNGVFPASRPTYDKIDAFKQHYDNISLKKSRWPSEIEHAPKLQEIFDQNTKLASKMKSHYQWLKDTHHKHTPEDGINSDAAEMQEAIHKARVKDNMV